MWNARCQLSWDFTEVAAHASKVLWAFLATQGRSNCIQLDKSPNTHPFKRKEEILLSFGLR